MGKPKTRKMCRGILTDQILVATARLNDSAILTKDRRILDYAHVNSLW
jgi:predicted nuclease of predicted toxin-antitoxin system